MSKLHGIMICVTRQKTCERLIRFGYELAQKDGVELYVVHAAKVGENYLGNPNEGEALNYLFQVSKQVGAEMNVIRSKHVVKTLADFAKKQKIATMVLGAAPDSASDNKIIQELQLHLPQMDFKVLPTA